MLGFDSYKIVIGLYFLLLHKIDIKVTILLKIVAQTAGSSATRWTFRPRGFRHEKTCTHRTDGVKFAENVTNVFHRHSWLEMQFVSRVDELLRKNLSFATPNIEPISGYSAGSIDSNL